MMKATLRFGLALAAVATAGFSGFAAEEPPAPFELTNYVELFYPNSTKANLTNTRQGYGMGVIELTLLNENIRKNDEGTAPVKLYRDDVLLRSMLPSDERVQFSGIAGAAEEPLPGPSSNVVTFWFCADSSQATEPGEEDPEIPLDPDASDFLTPGAYRLEIPEDFFVMADYPEAGQTHPFSGMTINYTFVDEAADVDYTWTLTPDPEVEATSLDEITLTFPNATSASYSDDSNGGATLLYPDGTAVYGGKYPTVTDNSLTYKYGTRKKPIEWVKGTYTFSIAPDQVTVDGEFFPGLTAVFGIGVKVSVTAIGLEAADSYDIYTIDGKTVAVGAGADALLALPEGIYVINSRKVRIHR